MLHVGLIGGGGITESHARAVAGTPGMAVAAVFGANAARAGAIAAAHGARAYTDYDAFLAHRPMDVVVIGSPSGLHAEQGIAAAARGLHVLVEKPIDISGARADALIAAADAARVRLGVIYQDRTKPGLVDARQLLLDGRIGRPLLASARVKWYRPPDYYGGSRWRGVLALNGGGALMNQGIHTVDLLLWLLGAVTRVQAVTRTALHDMEGEDVAIALLTFASGAVATLEATTCAFPGYPRQIELTGREGTLTIAGDDLVGADLRTPVPGLVLASPSGPIENAASPIVSDVSAHQRVIADFGRGVREGAPLICDGRDGRRSVAVVEAIYRAAASGGTVEVRG